MWDLCGMQGQSSNVEQDGHAATAPSLQMLVTTVTAAFLSARSTS